MARSIVSQKDYGTTLSNFLHYPALLFLRPFYFFLNMLATQAKLNQPIFLKGLCLSTALSGKDKILLWEQSTTKKQNNDPSG